MATLDEICAWLNKTYPKRDWDQECQRLMWNVIYFLHGYERDEQMVTYPTATAAQLASALVSTDASKAPVGAMHFWRNPAEGHVGVSLGGGRVLMTGTGWALGEGGVLRGNNYGVTTVDAYTRRKDNPYLGWAHTNGANESIVGMITDPITQSEPGGFNIMAADCFVRRSVKDSVYALDLMTGKNRRLTSLEWTVYQRARQRANLGVPITEEGPDAMKALVGKER